MINWVQSLQIVYLLPEMFSNLYPSRYMHTHNAYKAKSIKSLRYGPGPRTPARPIAQCLNSRCFFSIVSLEVVTRTLIHKV